MKQSWSGARPDIGRSSSNRNLAKEHESNRNSMLCTRGNVKLHIFHGTERISFLYSEQQKGDWLTTNIAEKKLVLMRQKKKQFRQIFGQIGFEIGNKLLLEDTSQSFIIYWLQVQLAPKTANLFRFEGPILYLPVLQVEEPGFWLEPHCLNSFARFSLC